MKIMKTCVFLTVLFLCLCSADGRECMTCTDFSCSSQSPQNCSYAGETLCYTTALNDSGTIRITKGCRSPWDRWCADGGVFYSYNYGSPYLWNTTCCDSDRCNSAQLPVPAPPAGSLQCYGWDPHTDVYTANVTCNAHEVCAGFVTSDRRPIYGCVSENICNSSLTNEVPLGQPTVCCNTSHCNAPELGLQCNFCPSYSCSEERSLTCYKTSRCHTHTLTYYTDESNYSFKGKGCIPENLCSAVGSDVFYFRTASIFETFSCCSSDHCNAPTPPTPAPAAVPLQCYGCDFLTENCTYVSCDAGQSCANFSYFGEGMKGCVSNNLCSNQTSEMEYYYAITSVSCCNTTHCNAPASAALSTTTTTTTTTTTLPAVPSSTAAPTKTDSSSVIFMEMSVESLGTVSNAMLSEAVHQFLREQLNSTGFVVSVQKILQPETETHNTTSAPGPTQAPPTP